MATSLLLQPFFRLSQFCSKLLLRGLSFYLEVPSARFPAIMRESQKVECLRLLSAFAGFLLGKPSELDQFRFTRLYLQVEFLQPLFHLSQKPFGFRRILKARQIIIRIPKIMGFASTSLLEALLEP